MQCNPCCHSLCDWLQQNRPFRNATFDSVVHTQGLSWIRFLTEDGPNLFGIFSQIIIL